MGGRRWRMWQVDRFGDDGERRKNGKLLVAACRRWILLGLTQEITMKKRFHDVFSCVFCGTHCD